MCFVIYNLNMFNDIFFRIATSHSGLFLKMKTKQKPDGATSSVTWCHHFQNACGKTNISHHRQATLIMSADYWQGTHRHARCVLLALCNGMQNNHIRLGRVVTNWQVWPSVSNRWWRNVDIPTFAGLTMENKQLFLCPWTSRCPVDEPSESHSFYIHYSCYKQWRPYGIFHLYRITVFSNPNRVWTILIRKHVPLANRK